MPRRKKIEIAVSELKTQDSLIAELEENPLFKGCDLSTLTVWAVVTSPPPEIMSAEKYINAMCIQYWFSGSTGRYSWSEFAGVL